MTRTSPVVGSMRLAISRSSVDFPHPDGPIRLTNSPGATDEVDVDERVDLPGGAGVEDLPGARHLDRVRHRVISAARPAGGRLRLDRRLEGGDDARPSPGRARPRRAGRCTSSAGSPDACRAYSMISRPTPPRRPVEISATTTPITDAVAASFSAGTMRGTAAGNRSLRIVWSVGGGEAAHQLERRRRRRLEPPQRADGDREEGEERAEHGDRQPTRPLPPADLQPPAPAHDERGEGDHRHGLGHDEVRHQAAADDAEAGHHGGQADSRPRCR